MNQACRDKLIAGVNLAADVAAVTYGPNGRNVISGNHITKDGMTAVSWITDEDPYVMMGVNLMKDIAKRTAEVAGDGTTTATLLAREIVNNCTKEDIPSLKSGLNSVIRSLQSQRKFVETKEDLEKVATLSANGDSNIGRLVAEAFNKAGKDGIVTFTESEEVDDSVVYSDGFRIDNGFASPGFTNTAQGTCELSNVYVYISDTKLEEAKQIIEIADECMRKGKSLLLVAPGFDSEIFVFLQSNLNILQSCCVISPAFKKRRSILVKDMRILLGEKSCCDKVIVTQKNTMFICPRQSEEISQRIEEIREILKTNLVEAESDFHKKRLANFTSGISTIYVGGYSQFEIKEKLDRIEDAVRATDCAVREGILPGAGKALLNCGIRELEEYPKCIVKLLSCPATWLGTTNKFNTFQEAYDSGVIEPYLVTKTALENAINIATTILNCDCAILPNNNF